MVSVECELIWGVSRLGPPVGYRDKAPGHVIRGQLWRQKLKIFTIFKANFGYIVAKPGKLVLVDGSQGTRLVSHLLSVLLFSR